MGVKIINLTSHPVVMLSTGKEYPPPPFEKILRVQKFSIFKEEADGAQVYYPEEEISGTVPPEEDGVRYIVSKKVAILLSQLEEYKHRGDFVYPSNIVHTTEESDMIDAYGKVVLDSMGNKVKKKNVKIAGCQCLESLVKDN